MPMIHLTRQDTPARPITINTDHVASIKPLRRLVPSSTSQTPGLVVPQNMGTELGLVNGDRVNVLEQYPDVLQLLSGLPPVASVEELVTGYVPPDQTPNITVEVNGVDQGPPTQGTTENATISDYSASLDPAQTEPDISNQVPEPKTPAKKAPAKKASADKKAGEDVA